MNYVIYHSHTDLSTMTTNIDSVNKVEDYANRAAELGMKALAISEHGNVCNWVHKKNVIEAAGLKYIHAEEFYITNDCLGCEEKHRDNYHMVLIARNWEGVKELNKLSSISFNRNDFHFYYTPRIGWEELTGTSDNIIITSACLGGVFNKGDKESQKKALEFFRNNKHRCFLEIQHHDCDDQKVYNKKLYEIHKRTGIPLIAGTDTHALDEAAAEARHLLQEAKMVHGPKSLFDDEDELDLTFKSYDELCRAYSQQGVLPQNVVLEAIENTNHMADMVEPFELDYSYKYPKLYADSEGTLQFKLERGMIKRGLHKSPRRQEYVDRIKHELEAIRHNGAIDFFLLEEDYKSKMRELNIVPGYSRGSCSGSVICYLLGITDIDPVVHNTNFDRFMNVERVSLADIDTDWDNADREVVKEYLYNKRGLYCCDIMAFHSIQLKAAAKEMARVFEIPFKEANTMTKELDSKEAHYRKQYPKVFHWADEIVGTIVSGGAHPSALVVSPIPIDEAFGTMTVSTNKYPISQIDMHDIDSLNFVKLDLLGLDNVGIINRTCELAGIERLTPQTVPDDEAVWKSIRDDTTNIFQFTSSFASDYIRRLLSDESVAKFKKYNPEFRYIDLMALATAALRPAGDSYRDELARGIVKDNGHEALNSFLAPSCGYLVYQEQIINFLNKFCGYTMGAADKIRRGFAKKLGTEQHIPAIKAGFIKTMKEEYGTPEAEAEKIITDFLVVIEDASNYLFSHNHALPYSYISYILGYLRYYYPYEFLTVALNTFGDDMDKTSKLIKYANKVGIKIKPIEFGYSSANYTFDREAHAIYKGMASIKFMNETVPGELMEVAKNKPSTFVDLLCALDNTGVNSRQLDILIKLNFFKRYGKTKKLLAIVELYNKLGKCKTIKKDKLYKPELFMLTESQVREFASKETAKQFGDIDNIGLIKSLEVHIDNASASLREQVEWQYEYLGHCDLASDNIPEYYWLVTEFGTPYDKNKPYVTLHNLHSGDEVRTRIKYAKVFKDNPFEKFDVLCFETLANTPKVRKDDTGNWIETGEVEQILNVYDVVKK